MQDFQTTNLSFDPIHKYIAFTDRACAAAVDDTVESDIINHPWLQRLRHIHQLQTAWYVFPTAEHSRFQHALGAMHLGGIAADRLYDGLNQVCQHVPSKAYVASLLRMAGLLHDVGHGPFGHFFDKHFLVHFDLTHETLGAHIIRHELADLLRGIRRSPLGPFEDDEQLCPDQIAWLITRPTDNEVVDRPKWLVFLRSLLCGIYTIDNIDFVLRDAYMTGYSPQSFDLDRLLHYSFFSDQGLTIHDRGVDSLIRFLGIRAELFRTVYFHRQVQAIDLTLLDLFADSREYLLPGNPIDHLAAYRDFTEWSLIVDVKRWQTRDDLRQRELGRRWQEFLDVKITWHTLCQRNLVFAERDAEHASIFSSPDFVEARIRQDLPTDLSDIPLRVDITRHVYRPHSRGSAGNQNFLYDSARNKVRPLRDHQLFRHLPVSHRICRVYGKSLSHSQTVATVLDKLIGNSGIDDVTNMYTRLEKAPTRVSRVGNRYNDGMDTYENPLTSRYASREMGEIWSPQRKFTTWRKLWIALAEAEQQLGLDITDAQLAELKQNVDNIDFDAARQHERRLRHDVMAHVHAYGDVCPTAMPIIHLGATSCYVTDNADLLLLRDALALVRDRLVAAIDRIGHFPGEYRALPCLGFTHLQPAQPTTVGKRACLWAYDLVLDLEEIERRLSNLKARSVKGTTGTQASFLKLFNGDHGKVRELERLVAEKIGFSQTWSVTGQTYPRKADAQIMDTLSGIAQSVHKTATDLRLLANRKEIEEPFEKHQIGSSAMAYKRNPMRSERMCALARFVMSLPANTAQTLANQWMERTLDDSANRRLVLPQAFLGTDALLILYENVASGLVVYPQVIASHLNEELPFMATENILMAAVAAGGDRQHLHERIRQHSQAAGQVVKDEGKPNDLIYRLKTDIAFASVDLDAAIDVSQFVGRAPEQVDEFLAELVEPIRKRYPDALERKGDVSV